jgi:hypothetical protein
MRRSSSIATTILRIGGCALLLTTCGAAKDMPPVTYPFSELRTLTVLPVIDNTGGNKKIDCEKVRRNVMKMLAKRRYVPLPGGDASALRGLNDEDLKTADAALVKRLVPEGERWALLVYVGDVASKTTFGSSANAQIFGFLFDRQNGKLAWKDVGTGKAASGGLLGMMLKGEVTSEAVQMAMFNMLAAYPRLPKERK